MMSELMALFARQESLRIHMIGIGGVGMAGLARLLHQQGHRVQGTEQTSSRLVAWLQDEGISVQLGHDPTLIDASVDLVIRTSAVPLDHPECERARQCAIPLYRRGEVFPLLLRTMTTVAVTGTHGKTTTTAMIVHLLRRCGMNPGYFVGGESAQLGAIADLGDGQHMIVEADESDGTLVHYRPTLAVVTNVEFDHMEHFADEAAMLACFSTFLATCKRVIYCRDDVMATTLCADMEHALGYGFSESAEVRIDAWTPERLGGRLSFEGRDYGLPFGGRHNALNAMAALTLARTFYPAADIESLNNFQSVDRRFQVVAQGDAVTVVSDYAHHPSEIRATLEIACGLGAPRIVAIYQPHRYSRTKLLGPSFPPAFAGLDHLILCPVYAASEQPIPGGTHQDLARLIRAHGTPEITEVNNLDEAWDHAVKQLEGEGLLLILGAGDVVELVDRATEKYG
jgi:UDP-N-acetylmuramate--alanine ligase